MELGDVRVDRRLLQDILEEETESGRECGCQLAVYRGGQLVVSLAAGYTSAERTKKVDETTLFPVFSCGKGVMSTAVHQLVEQGQLSYEDRLADYWPEFGCKGKEDIRLWQVLSHRTGLQELPQVETMEDVADWGGMCARMAQAEPIGIPGTVCNYQAVTFAWLVGETVRRATGKSLRDHIREGILKPLGIQSLFFGTTNQEDLRCADVDDTRKADSWCANFFHCLPIRHGFVPSANGCGNALALARHYAALIGEVDGVRLLKPETVELATRLRRDERDPIPAGSWQKFGLGYALCGPAGHLSCMFGHGGALGGEGFAVPELGLAVGFTKNQDSPTHPRHEVRDRLSDALGLPHRLW